MAEEDKKTNGFRQTKDKQVDNSSYSKSWTPKTTTAASEPTTRDPKSLDTQDENYKKMNSSLDANLKMGSNYKNPVPAEKDTGDDARYEWQKTAASSDFMKNWQQSVIDWENKCNDIQKEMDNWVHIEVLDRMFNVLGSSYKDLFAAFDMLFNGGAEFEKAVNNRPRRSIALQPDDILKGSVGTYSLKKLESQYSDKILGKDGLQLFSSNPQGGDTKTKIKWGGSWNNYKPEGRSRKALGQTENGLRRDAIDREVEGWDSIKGGGASYKNKSASVAEENLKPNEKVAPFFKNSIVDLLPKSFLEMSFSDCISTIARDDPGLTNCQFILYKLDKEKKVQIFDFRIKNWQVPEKERKVGNIKYGNSVMSLTVNNYATHKSVVDMDIIIDRQLTTLIHIMKEVGIGTLEDDFINLSSGFDNKFTDLGTVYLQVIPQWYLSAEQNVGGPAKNYTKDIKDLDQHIATQYPLFCFTDVMLRTLDLPLKFSTKEVGKSWTLRVQASYEKLYETSGTVKEDLLASEVIKPTIAFTKPASD